MILGISSGCGTQKEKSYYLTGTVIEIKENVFLIEVQKDDLFYIGKDAWKEQIGVGDSVTVEYDGMVQETFPGEIPNIYSITVN